MACLRNPLVDALPRVVECSGKTSERDKLLKCESLTLAEEGVVLLVAALV